MTDSAMHSPTAIAHRLETHLAHLRRLTQLDIQDRWCATTSPALVPPPPGAIAPLNDRRHIAWDQGRQVLWLQQRIIVPSDLDAYPLDGMTLRLSLTWWAEQADLFVNGAWVQAGDLFDCSTRVVLTHTVQPGQSFNVALRLVSPGHDRGALVQSCCLYEIPQGQLDPVPEPGFVADELAVLLHYAPLLQGSQTDSDLLTDLAQALEALPWEDRCHRSTFDRALVQLRSQFRPWGELLKQRHIQALGHAHLDMAWLWPVAETWDAAERTFQSALDLQNDYPDLVFGHSTPALYAWMAEHRPALFSQIQQRVQEGRWDVIAGLWVEPDFNVVQGESIVRQVLYGQRYTQATFGQVSAIAWLPDSFGFCWQLPQIFRQGGIEYFATLKLGWNDTTQFPYSLFRWRSPDGSEITSVMLPPIGVGIDPVKMAQTSSAWEQSTQEAIALWLPGVGDHGGGPTRDMLETARRWQQSPFFPRLTFGTAHQFVRSLATQNLPLWQDELYLELHRGCYTTHADQKWFNRRCEEALYQAELWSSIAALMIGQDYPAPALETAWKQVLFNQFHDILPGSSIPQVFVDANQDWQAALDTAQTLRDRALQAIAAHCRPPYPCPEAKPVLLVNSLPWQRSQAISLALPAAHWQVVDHQGNPLPLQRTSDPLRVYVQTTVPGIGYAWVWLVPGEEPEEIASMPEAFVLEQDHLRVTLDASTGDIAELWDKLHQRSVLGDRGNQLQAFGDRGQYWDAWNIAPDYLAHPLPPAHLEDMQWLEYGPLRQSVQVIRRIGQSTICQRYVLEVGSPLLTIETDVDWQETQVVLKAAVPLAIASDRVSYEMPFGTIERPTQSDEPRDQAKWEVPMLRWADLSLPDQSYGVSLLSDVKHGIDSQPNQLRLTLLKAPLWPDPQADRGHHTFRYALYPHGGGYVSAQTVHHAAAFNQPIQAIAPAPRPTDPPTPALPPVATLLTLPKTTMLSAFKRSEDSPTDWILRYYDAYGVPCPSLALEQVGAIAANLNPATVQPVNLLEYAEEVAPASLHPAWAIVSVKVSQLSSLPGSNVIHHPDHSTAMS